MEHLHARLIHANKGSMSSSFQFIIAHTLYSSRMRESYHGMIELILIHRESKIGKKSYKSCVFYVCVGA